MKWIFFFLKEIPLLLPFIFPPLISFSFVFYSHNPFLSIFFSFFFCCFPPNCRERIVHNVMAKIQGKCMEQYAGGRRENCGIFLLFYNLFSTFVLCVFFRNAIFTLANLLVDVCLRILRKKYYLTENRGKLWRKLNQRCNTKASN